MSDAEQEPGTEATEKTPAAPVPVASDALAVPANALAPVDHGTVVTSGLAMKRRHPLAVWLGLPLITLGIYHLVWYYKIHKEMAEYDRRRSIPVVGPMLVLIFLSWTLIAPIISYHNTGSRIRAAQRSAGLTPSCSPTLAWLLVFVIGLNVLYLQIELNKVVDRYGGAPTGTEVPLYA